ncbi:TetR/AcrR family transcriptional regulator [Microbacterium ulmi]|uniref:TetR/AcrR family transcriptional regulator n=1 Tax=Microbacterium ulmi TaxID=179095 RepID=A0A7Y2Q1D4_9MICO|nr:TetR/AcrR family transcriptional regulator [Microbacterium ulmi]NII69868.1 AcrR family transcriptional regulator [Microbacterium ulmi]NNH03790.1 TetR/AcrR family transcriptional regulator [Microbacterium ulmi]
MPTGVALRDPRSQLLAAGERALVRDGPAGLTSRTVTEEAGVAKGVLHRHFADFDDFLATLVRERIAAVDALSADLSDRAGSGTVIGNLSEALLQLFDPLGLALVRLVLSRDELRARLQGGARRGIPMLAEAVDGLAGYLAAEQRVGRIRAGAAPAAVANALVGTGHLLFAGELGGLPDESAVQEVVAAVVVGAEPGAEDPSERG